MMKLILFLARLENETDWGIFWMDDDRLRIVEANISFFNNKHGNNKKLEL